MKTTISELQDFVVTQAAEDSVLSSSEKRYQAELVADVLGQEAPSNKALKELLALYRAQRQSS